MSTRFPHPSVRNDYVPPAEYADCCSATAAVRVIVPPGQARHRPTPLLLCGHHYRVSRDALTAASAVVRGLPGTPSDIAAWIQLDHEVCPASAN
jgi:hypothetical protein